MNFEYPPHLHHSVSSIRSAPVIDARHTVIGWTTLVLDHEHLSLGTGTAHSKTESIRIAVAESIETLEIRYGLSLDTKQRFRMTEFPTRCGIAVGFDRRSTFMRSQAEAFERWIWSKWIDGGHLIEQTSTPELNSLAVHYLRKFESVIFFHHVFANGALSLKQPLLFGAVIAFKDGGAYPGSRVCSLHETPWEHALIEAWRHLKITESLDNRNEIYPILKSRLKYFSNNAESAINQAKKGKTKKIGTPEIDFICEGYTNPNSSHFIVRSICKDYIPWHLGDNERFVY